MKRQFSGVLLTLGMLVWAATGSGLAWADKLTFKDGTEIEGRIQKVEKGEVTVQIGAETKVFSILDILGMEFDTPSGTDSTTRLPGEHFLASMEAKTMVEHLASVERAAAEIRQLIDETQQAWGSRSTIDPGDLPRWAAGKERFVAPIADYQEALNDLYVHVLAKVGQYNELMKEANQIHVGVRGVFAAGSPLVPKDKQKLPLKKYVPASWYDTIYYEGYNQGYNAAFEKYRDNLRIE